MKALAGITAGEFARRRRQLMRMVGDVSSTSVGVIIFTPITLRTGKLVPFGIFLAVGAAVTDVWGNDLIGWYQTQFLGM